GGRPTCLLARRVPMSHRIRRTKRRSIPSSFGRRYPVRGRAQSCVGRLVVSDSQLAPDDLAAWPHPVVAPPQGKRIDQVEAAPVLALHAEREDQRCVRDPIPNLHGDSLRKSEQTQADQLGDAVWLPLSECIGGGLFLDGPDRIT